MRWWNKCKEGIGWGSLRREFHNVGVTTRGRPTKGVLGVTVPWVLRCCPLSGATTAHPLGSSWGPNRLSAATIGPLKAYWSLQKVFKHYFWFMKSGSNTERPFEGCNKPLEGLQSECKLWKAPGKSELGVGVGSQGRQHCGHVQGWHYMGENGSKWLFWCSCTFLLPA